MVSYSTVEIIFSIFVESTRVSESSGHFVVTIIRAGDINVDASVDLQISDAIGELIDIDHDFIDSFITYLHDIILKQKNMINYINIRECSTLYV